MDSATGETGSKSKAYNEQAREPNFLGNNDRKYYIGENIEREAKAALEDPVKALEHYEHTMNLMEVGAFGLALTRATYEPSEEHTVGAASKFVGLSVGLAVQETVTLLGGLILGIEVAPVVGSAALLAGAMAANNAEQHFEPALREAASRINVETAKLFMGERAAKDIGVLYLERSFQKLRDSF